MKKRPVNLHYSEDEYVWIKERAKRLGVTQTIVLRQLVWEEMRRERDAQFSRESEKERCR